MLAPCMFVATACGDDPEDPSNLTTDLTIEQQQEAYTTLRTVAAAALNNDGSKDQSYTMQSNMENTENINLDNSGLTAENRTMIENSSRLNYSTSINRSVYGGYKSNNTGYRIESLKTSDNYYNHTETVAEIVKYNGQYYELYQNDNDNKSLFKVNNVYAKNTFVINENELFEGIDYQDLYYLFQYAKDNTTFNAFKDVLVDWTTETIAESKIQNVESVDFSDYISTQYAFSVTDNVYTLKIDLTVDATNAVVVYLEDGVLTGDGSVTISFDKDSIKRLTFDYNSVMTSKSSSASVFLEDVNQEFTANDVVVETKTKSVSVGIDFTTAFDDNYFNQSLEGYTGTGSDGEVKTVEVEGTLSLANANIDDSVVVAKFNYNDNLLSSIENELSYILGVNNLFIQSCYFIVDGDLIKITENTVVPSTEFSVYVELTDEVREFVETNVTIFVVNDSSENLCSFYIDDNLYNEVKAVMGLTDEQIAGIYSDAELENLLDSTTLITENMTVYLVLNSSVSSDN